MPEAGRSCFHGQQHPALFMAAALLVLLGLCSGCSQSKSSVSCVCERPYGSIELILSEGSRQRVQALEVVMTYPANYDEEISGRHLPLDEGDLDGSLTKKNLLKESMAQTLKINPDLVTVSLADDHYKASAKIYDVPALFETLGIDIPDLSFETVKAELEQSASFICS